MVHKMILCLDDDLTWVMFVKLLELGRLSLILELNQAQPKYNTKGNNFKF